MEPASTIIKLLGGPSKVASVVGVHRTRVSNWSRPRESGGTGGKVPAWHIPKLIDFAKETGKPLSIADFFNSDEAAQ